MRLEGKLERVLWSSERTGYAVVRLETPDGSVMAVGALVGLLTREPGSFVSLEGDFEDHAVHGRQFRANGLLDWSPHTEAGLRIWLASAGISGIGKRMAERLVDRFGLDLLSVLDAEPERLREVSGMGAARVAAVLEAWEEGRQGRALTLLLRGLGLSQRLTDRIADRYGERAEQVVRKEPYRLADEIGGIGFRTADALARELGLPKDDPQRARAALRWVLDQAAEQDGHCWLPSEEIARLLAELEVPGEALPEAIRAAEAAGAVVVEGERIWPAPLWSAEERAARTLRWLLGEAPAVGGDPRSAERWVGVTLDPSQRDAVALALRSRVVVVTGGPGTGKTTLLRVLLRMFVEGGLTVALASPTGRAARRMEEASGMPASTIHRLLGVDPRTGGFVRGLGQPLDADVVVVDEASMVDLPLFAALLDALPIERAPRLVLVGDVDQLPSVGPGQVLRDLLDSGVVPVARLSVVHRQAADSGILAAAADVREGRVPDPPVGVRDVFLLGRPDPEEAVRTLLRVVSERLPAHGFLPAEIQVLTPTRRGVLGAQRLNAELQALLNPGGPELARGDLRVRLHDRVICTKNRYDLEVFNGDTGRVVAVAQSGLTVEFDGRTVQFERDDLGNLDLAYALTVHKSQGSEYGAVVVALHGSAGLLLRRNLFYTAVTRAKRFLCVVGSPEAWGRAVRSVGGDDRRTGLPERLRYAAAREEGE